MSGFETEVSRGAECALMGLFAHAYYASLILQALENDLDGTEKKVIPDLMRRLLYTLTLNRSIE